MIPSSQPLPDIYEYLSTYGAQIAVWAILSAVTVYRREISCNRSYHEDDGDENSIRKDLDERDDNISIVVASEEKVLTTEELLDGAGLYCSGRPIFNIAELLRIGFDSTCKKDKREYPLEDLKPEDILERVGNYASPEPILAILAFFTIWKKTELSNRLQPLSSTLSSLNKIPLSAFLHKLHGCDPLNKGLPPEIHVHIASFLHPRDVVTLSGVSKSYRCVTHDPNNATATAIWKALWERDYGWIVFKWKIGKQAFQRSNCKDWKYGKEFYFIFGQSYLDYVLAGHNTFQSCLVGIHSNIYDITPFIFSHPGSPDTLMVHSGRDATGFFDDIGHSTGARKLAMSMCVVVDRSSQSHNDDCGLFPTSNTIIENDEDDVGDNLVPVSVEVGADKLVEARKKRRRTIRTGNASDTMGGGTLYQIRARFIEEREKVRIRNTRKYSRDSTILGHEVNTYFDPFIGRWRIWYTDTDLRTIFLPSS